MSLKTTCRLNRWLCANNDESLSKDQELHPNLHTKDNPEKLPDWICFCFSKNKIFNFLNRNKYNN